ESMPCSSGVETSHDFVGHGVSAAAWTSGVPADAWQAAKHTSPVTSAAMVILRRMLAISRPTLAARASGVPSLLYYPEPEPANPNHGHEAAAWPALRGRSGGKRPLADQMRLDGV